MTEKTVNYECNYCFVEYEIIYQHNQLPDYCPFCGELLETDSDEDNWFA